MAGIRTHYHPLKSATYRFYVPRNATNATAAKAACPILPDGWNIGMQPVELPSGTGRMWNADDQALREPVRKNLKRLCSDAHEQPIIGNAGNLLGKVAVNGIANCLDCQLLDVCRALTVN